ncbi:hypothetical protein K1719_041219 [Acacia pycnantha]|nr:hypothetical protein K1719_041219 [Acacia pycnantha]
MPGSYNVGGPSFVDKLKGSCSDRDVSEKKNDDRKDDLSDDSISDDDSVQESFKLSNKDDYAHALTGGPWMLYDHYLTVQPREPKFRPDKASIDKAAIWVRKETCPKGKQIPTEETVVGHHEQAHKEAAQGPEQSTVAQWRVVQKPRRQKKLREKSGESVKQQNGGSRFEVLAEVAEINPNAMTNQVDKQQVEVSDMVFTAKGATQQGVRGRVKDRREGGNQSQKKKDEVVANGMKNVTEVEEQRGKRNVGKRLRGLLEKDENVGALLITMGEGNDVVPNEEDPADNIPHANMELVSSPQQPDPGDTQMDHAGPELDAVRCDGPGMMEDVIGESENSGPEANCGPGDVSMVPETQF